MVEIRPLGLEQTQKFDRQLLAALACAEPHTIEVSIIADVLGYCNSHIQVEDRVPPVARDEHRLTRVLDAFDPIRNLTRPSWPFLGLESWQNEVKVLNSFIVLSFGHQMLASHQIFVNFLTWRDQQPPLAARHTRVPCRCAQWILMDLATRPLWANQKPPVRRRLFLAKQLREQILPQELRWLILWYHCLGLWVVL